MDKLVLGLFQDKDAAEQAIDTLQSDGFDTKNISIAMKDNKEAKDMGNSTGATVAGDAATGATTGAVVGGVAGFLAGTVMPALGGFLIGGPIGAALGLSGAAATTVSGAATGAVAGGLLGALVGLGVPKKDAQHYESKVKEGAILLAVPTAGDEESTVRDIFEECDATDIKAVDATTTSHTAQQSQSRESSGSKYHQFASAGAKGGSTKGKKKIIREEIEEVE